MPRDPLSDGEEGSPYEALAAAGITPVSSAREIRDAAFALMDGREMTAEERRAWDLLRRPARRLAADFFLPHGDFEEEAG